MMTQHKIYFTSKTAEKVVLDAFVLLLLPKDKFTSLFAAVKFLNNFVE